MWVAVVFCAVAAYAQGDSHPPKNVEVVTVDGRTVWISAAFVPKPDNPPVCQKRQLNRAITYYRTAYRQHREAMWLEGPVSRVWYHDCDTLKRRAVDWRDRADVARIEYIEWHVYQYNWRDWLPWHWYRVGSCETGSGGPPNWRHSNSQYQGAFGFAISSWDDYVGRADPKAGPYPSEAYLATPRQQYEVALAIYRQYGMSGWGCKG